MLPNVRGLDFEFLSEFERVLDGVRTNPEAGSPGAVETHRFLTRRFPYSVVYLIEPFEVVVIAVAYHRRKPLYWLGRI